MQSDKNEPSVDVNDCVAFLEPYLNAPFASLVASSTAVDWCEACPPAHFVCLARMLIPDSGSPLMDLKLSQTTTIGIVLSMGKNKPAGKLSNQPEF